MKKYLLFFVLCILLCLSVIDLFHPGLPVTHDGQDHVARIANFYENLQQGNIIPRWAGNLNWGYGHPILEFLYPFPSYLASFFHFVGFSLVGSFKIVLALGVVLSGIGMFLWVSDKWGKESGLLAGLLYAVAPYRMVDVYVRGDIGENLAFAWVPFLCWSMDRFITTKNQLYLIFSSIFLALLITSHNAIALMMVPFIVFYAGFLIFQTKRKTWYAGMIILSIAVGFLLSAFFWIPGLLEARYTLRNIVTAGVYASRFVSFGQLLYGPWNYGQTGQFTLQIGMIQWIALVASVFFLFKQKSLREQWFISALLLFSAMGIFLMLLQSQFVWQKILLLQNFQFPWRFLAIPVFTASVLAGFVVAKIPSQYKKLSILIAILTIFIFQYNYFHAQKYIYKPESFFTGIYKGTTDTGESSPIWSIRFMEHGYNSPLEIIQGNASIRVSQHVQTKHVYIVNSSVQTKLLENTLYFPGWNVLVDGQPVPIEFQNPLYRGLMTFSVPAGQHLIDVVYTETKLRFISDIISTLSLGLTLAWLLCLLSLRYNKRHR